MENYYQKDLAFVHDLDFVDLAFEASKYLIDLLAKEDISEGLILDLGCGSGVLSAQLDQAGYETIGVDLSRELLSLAREQFPDGKFVQSSIHNFEFPPAQVVCLIGEIICYNAEGLEKWHRTRQLFERAYNCLSEDGMLLFDFVVPGMLSDQNPKHRIIEHPDYALFLEFWEDEEREILEREITIFRKMGEYYRKSKEVHQVDQFDTQKLLDLLERIGFSTKVLDHFNELQFRDHHLAILARKTNPKG
ncbi:MAG: class I SAM-dependent methyltransferase [Bacteroidota bacterium]